MEHADMAGDWHYNDANKARYYYLAKQIKVNESMIATYQRLLTRLGDIEKTPDLRTPEEILVGSHTLSKDLKDQICSILD